VHALLRRHFETNAASWHSCSIWKRVFCFSCGTVLHAKETVALLDQETPDFIPPALWSPNSPNLNPVDWLHRVDCASGASLSYQDLGCRRTETTRQQRVGHSESHGYWMCCWRNGISVYVLAFVLEEDILSTRCNKDDVTFLRDTETITASHVCRYSVNHSNVHFEQIEPSTRLNLPLQIFHGSASTYIRWSGHFRDSFVKDLFRDNPSNFYWNRFIFDRQGAKDKLA